VILTATERVLSAFRHEEADRVPNFGECRNVGFIEHVTCERLRGTPEVLERITAEAYARIGVDAIRTLKTPRWGIERGEDHDTRWDGYFSWKIGGERVFTYEEAVEYMKTRWCDDAGKDPRDEAVRRIAEVNRIQALLGDRTLYMPMVPASCLESMYHGIGIENFSLMMYLDGHLIDEALERNAEWAVAMVEVMHEIYDGPVIHSCDDLGMKGKTIFAPEWLRAHVFPRMKRVAQAIHDGSKYFSFHSCGNVTAVIPDLLDVGIDALNPIEVTSGMNLREVKEKYGEHLVIIGNANANIVQMGSPEDVRQEVRRCLDDAACGGGYFLAGGKTPATPIENLVAYYDEARTYQGYRHG